MSLVPAAAYAARPTLSGPELLHQTDNGIFRVHYTTVGIDAPTNLEDLTPANSVPDVIDDIELGMDRVWQEYVVLDGWPAPAPDDGRGGDDLLDVYIRDINIYGYAHYERQGTGYTAYFEIDHDASSTGHLSLQGIAGHELHHGLQAAIVTGAGSWIYEATSTWVQYTLFKGNFLQDVASQVLWTQRLGGAAQRFDQTGDRFEYAGFIWIQFLMQHAGSRTALLGLWQDMGEESGWETGHRRAMARFGFDSLEQAIALFHEWNVFACYRDDGNHYDPAGLPCEFESAVPAQTIVAFPGSVTTVEVERFGAAYVELRPDCTSQALSVNVSSTARHASSILRTRASGGPLAARSEHDAQPWTDTVDGWNDGDSVVVVLTNLDNGPATFTVNTDVSGTYVPAPQADGATQIQIAPGEVPQLTVGSSVTLAATGTFRSCADGAVITGGVTWASSDPSVATVNNGVVTAVAPGSALISATGGAVRSNEVFVSVQDAPPDDPENPLGLPGCSSAGHVSSWIVLAALMARRRR